MRLPSSFSSVTGQLSGLEQQCFTAERLGLEVRNKIRVCRAVSRFHGAGLPLHQEPVQVARLSGPEPVRPEFALSEEIRNVMWVCIAKPVAAVVPCQCGFGQEILGLVIPNILQTNITHLEI